jgi:hypothetical protein
MNAYVFVLFTHLWLINGMLDWYVQGVEGPVTNFHAGLSIPLACFFLQGQAKLR